MAQYYTLEEAARVLQTTADEVRRIADEKKLRTFRDKGTLRYRALDIDELARQMGLGSDVDLQLGEVPMPKKGNSPAPRSPAPGPKSSPPGPKNSPPGPKSSPPTSKSSPPAKRPSKV